MLTPNTTMKSKLKISAGILLLVAFSLAGSLAQSPSVPVATVPRAFNPNTGLPLTPAPQAFDPTTGQPIPPEGSEWKDANWKDPDIVLTNVNFDGQPVSEIANVIRDQFKGEFDLLLPQDSIPPGSLNLRTGLPMEATDWYSYSINLRLKNVTASELFNAMNLLFENDKTPLRWELKVNDNRQIALLRVMTQPMPAVPAAPPAAVERRVYFVGNLIGDQKNGGMTMEQIIKTVTDIWKMANVSDGKIQFHEDAQLLVVTGTRDQIDFMDQTLQALRDKMVQKKIEQQSTSAKTADAKSKSDDLVPAKK